MTVLVIILFGFVCGWLGWVLCSWRAEVIETHAWWAARPHINGIKCPAEAECEICTSCPAAGPATPTTDFVHFTIHDDGTVTNHSTGERGTDINLHHPDLRPDNEPPAGSATPTEDD